MLGIAPNSGKNDDFFFTALVNDQQFVSVNEIFRT